MEVEMKAKNVNRLQNVIYGIAVMIMITIIVWVMMGGMAQAGEVTLAWNANTESDLGGYRLYYGRAPGKYTYKTDAGNVTQFTLQGVENNVKMYYVLTAYDIFGNESGYSNEVEHIIESDPGPPKNPGFLKIIQSSVTSVSVQQ
jgi:hypothetical protein